MTESEHAALSAEVARAIGWDRVNACGIWPSHVEFTHHSLGHGIRLRDRAGAEPTEWPEDLRVREFPE